MLLYCKIVFTEMWFFVLVHVLNYSLSAIFPLLSVKMLTTVLLKYYETHLHLLNTCTRKVLRIGTVRYNWPMSAHASQAFSIAHCTDSEDLPCTILFISRLTTSCNLFHCDMTGWYDVTCCRITHLSAK